MIKNYLEIMEDSLKKKLAVLDEIIEYNSGQEELLKKEKVSLDELDTNMNQKDKLIRKLVKLDEGFEILYERIREQLLENKDSYKAQIKCLQELIAKVTEKSVSVQVQEARNKKMVENYFAKEKSQIGQGRQASKVAYDYYKNMSNANVVPPQIMDQKK